MNFLLTLLYRKRLGLSIRLEPEQRLSIEIADWLREMSLTGKLKAVWTHIPNEGKRSRIVALVLAAMGMISGVSDYVFSWADGSGYIELKAGANKETDNQILFSCWCEALGVHHATCRTLEEVQTTLKEWGVI